MTPPHIAAGTNPNMPLDRRAAEPRRRSSCAAASRRTTLCGGLPRIPAPDAGARLSDRVLIEGGRSRTGWLAPKARHPRHDDRQLRPQPQPSASVRPRSMSAMSAHHRRRHLRARAGRAAEAQGVAAAAAEHGAHIKRVFGRVREFRRTAAARRLSRRAPRRLAGGGCRRGRGGAMRGLTRGRRDAGHAHQ